VAALLELGADSEAEGTVKFDGHVIEGGSLKVFQYTNHTEH
jgi:hypothetical protein